MCTEEELRQVVGPRSSYYLRAWRPGGWRVNFAAFFGTGMWLAYRRMYRYALMFFSALLLTVVAEELVFTWWLELGEVPVAWTRLVTFATALSFGALGNSLYRGHVERISRLVKEQHLEPSEEARQLAKRGGTSGLAPLVAIIGFTVAVIACYAVLEQVLPAYVDEVAPWSEQR